MIEGASPYKVFGRKKRSKCFKPKPRRVSWQSQRDGHRMHKRVEREKREVEPRDSERPGAELLPKGPYASREPVISPGVGRSKE